MRNNAIERLWHDLDGTWNLTRYNTQKSYTLDATATITAQSTTSKIWIEQGTAKLHTPQNVQKLDATRHFILKFAPENNAIEIHFNDHRKGLYLTLEQAPDTPVLTGTHLCPPDVYTMSLAAPSLYNRAAPQLTRFESQTTISGPKKDETLLSIYKRVNA